MKKQTAATLAFNRQHRPGTVPARVQTADLATPTSTAPQLPITPEQLALAARVTLHVHALMLAGRWYGLGILAAAAEDVFTDSPENRRNR
jgi:hypothetical protein